jgi:hypothetical protein
MYKASLCISGTFGQACNGTVRTQQVYIMRSASRAADRACSMCGWSRLIGTPYLATDCIAGEEGGLAVSVQIGHCFFFHRLVHSPHSKRLHASESVPSKGFCSLLCSVPRCSGLLVRLITRLSVLGWGEKGWVVVVVVVRSLASAGRSACYLEQRTVSFFFSPSPFPLIWLTHTRPLTTHAAELVTSKQNLRKGCPGRSLECFAVRSPSPLAPRQGSSSTSSPLLICRTGGSSRMERLGPR